MMGAKPPSLGGRGSVSVDLIAATRTRPGKIVAGQGRELNRAEPRGVETDPIPGYLPPEEMQPYRHDKTMFIQYIAAHS